MISLNSAFIPLYTLLFGQFYMEDAFIFFVLY